jgi:prephenate dehydrogenase
MAGSGFESTVRLAKSSPKMWTDIFDDNKVNVLKSLSDYIYNLELIKNLIEKSEFKELELQLKKTNYIKKILKGINYEE